MEKTMFLMIKHIGSTDPDLEESITIDNSVERLIKDLDSGTSDWTYFDIQTTPTGAVLHKVTLKTTARDAGAPQEIAVARANNVDIGSAEIPV